MGKALILLFVLPFTCSCIAQSTQLNNLHFNHLSIKNGLPEGVITALLQDKEGYMWIGTQGGLVRYDGYSAKVYQFGLEDPLRAAVLSIYEDRAGGFWIGTAYEGLYHYNSATDTFTHYRLNKHADSSNITFIYSVQEDLHGNLWMIMQDFEGKGKSVNRFNIKKQQFKQFGFLEKGNHYINASEYLSLCGDSKGRMWVGTNNGI